MTETMISLGPSGTLLKRERMRQRLTMRELAHFSDVSHATIQRVENGTLNASPQVKTRIARALRRPVWELWPEGDGIFNESRPPAGIGGLDNDRAGGRHERL